MMKKIILTGIVFLFFINIVLSDYSTDSADYYKDYHNGLNYVDGLTFEDKALNGSIPVNNSEVGYFGWKNQSDGNAIYSDEYSYLGDLSIKMHGESGHGYLENAIEFANSSFTGQIDLQMYLTTRGTTKGYLFFYDASNHFCAIGSRPEYSNGDKWDCYAGTWGTCTFNQDMPLNNWVNINYNATDRKIYINHTVAFECINLDINSSNKIYFYTTSAIWFIDVFRISNNALPLGEEDFTPPFISTNLSNNTKYTSDIDFYVSINESGNCNVNDSNWLKTNINDTYFIFNDISAENKNYNLLISCSDDYNNYANLTYNITKAIPSIIIFYPPNNTYVKGTEINITFQFYNFNPNICLGYYNYTENGNYIAGINISESAYNITINSGYSYNLLGYYRGESLLGNIAYDSSNYSYNGISYNVNLDASKGSNSTLSNSYGFNSGSKSHINISDKDIYSFGDGTNDKPFSITAWIYLNNTGTGDMIINKRNDAKGNYEWDFQITGSGFSRLQFNLWDSSTSGRLTRRYDTPLGNNEWMFITGTYNANKSSEGMKLYLNAIRVDDLSVPSGSYTAMENTNAKVVIGARGDITTAFFDGKIDELTLWNITLNQSQITALYNYGVQNITSIQTIEGGELNESQNITFHATFEEEGKFDFKYYVQCHNNITVNSTINMIHFDNDFTPPIINIIYPDDDNKTWNHDINITFSLNENANCSINNTAFNNLYDNGTYFIYKEISLNNSYYSVMLSCEDISENTRFYVINFTKDKLFPTLDFLSPSIYNTSSTYENIDIIINTSDNNALYYLYFNVTELHHIPYISDFYDNIYEYEKNISGTNYIYYNNLNISNLTTKYGDKYINAFVCDAHTLNKIDNFYSVSSIKPDKIADKEIKESDKTKLIFKPEKNINIEIISDNDVNAEYIKLKDRYAFSFEYSDKKNKKEYILKSNEKIAYLPNSDYKGHFIIYSGRFPKYWLDFQNDYDIEVIKNNKSNEYYIYSYSPEMKDNFNSIGALNCLYKSVKFEYKEYSEETISNFNLNFNSIQNMMLLGILIFLWFGMLIISIIFKNFGFASFAFFLGIIIGLALYFYISFMTLLFILTNIVFYIRAGTKFKS